MATARPPSSEDEDMNNNNNKNISFLSSLSRRATRIAHNGASSDARSRARAIPGDDDGGARRDRVDVRSEK